MPLYLVGLGLGNENDVSVNGLAAIKRSERVFLEHYTSILGVPQDKLEKFYGKKVELADRTRVESEADVILEAAKTQNVSFLVVGDPYCATTHTDLALRARAEGIKVTVFHKTIAAVRSFCLPLFVLFPFILFTTAAAIIIAWDLRYVLVVVLLPRVDKGVDIKYFCDFFNLPQIIRIF